MRQQRSSLSRRNCSENIGREPGPDDPFFFEPIAAVPNFLSDESTDEVWKSLLQAAGESGIDPAII